MRIVGIALLFSVMAFSGCEFSQPAPPVPPPQPPRPPVEKLADVMGIKNPQTCLGTHVALHDAAPILGVVVGDKSRAYLLEALEVPPGTYLTPGLDDDSKKHLANHVVNDQVNGVSIAVTYCDTNRCTRVFSSPDNTPLELRVGGWKNRQMLLKLKDQSFLQNSEDAPLPPFPFEESTWGEWYKKHPDTDIYLGEQYEIRCRPKPQ